MRLRTTFVSFISGISGIVCFSLALAAVLGASSLGAGCSTSDDNGNDAGTPAPYGLDTRPGNTTCKAPARPPNTASVKLQQVFANVNIGNPMMLAQLPNDPSRWYVAERSGKLLSFPVQNPTATRQELDIGGQITDLGSEGGLLGMAFHPNFAQNGYVYLSYTTGTEEQIVSTIKRFTSAAKNGTAFGAQSDVLAFNQERAGNHKGGCVGFGPDGFLYASFGDGGGGGDGFRHGQETNSFFSKILRIDINGAAPYTIPDDNPFKNDTTGKKKEIFAYGFRNPFRFSFDIGKPGREGSGELWVGDVGQDNWEEIDKVRKGGNYGWSIKEGTHCFPSSTTNCSSAGLIDPVYDYPQPNGNARAVTGGRVYRGKAIPELVGSYIFADSSSAEAWALNFDPASGKPVVIKINDAGTSGTFTSVAEDSDGELYLTTLGGDSGKIFKVVPNAKPEPSGVPFPEKLSQTGCVDPNNAKNPASGLVPYSVNSPLWSDGADKERYLALPDGQKIHVNADGDFDLPIGSVLMKTFSLGGKRIETRLFVRHTDGDWGGYSYEWNDDQTDATLLAANKSKPVGGQTWYYPSRSDCVSCHSTVAGRTLGLEIGQLNGDFSYVSTGRLSNQLATFEHIGLLDAPLGGPPETLTRFPTPAAAGDLENRVASYLHSNCSFCHRPNGIGGGGTDFRYTTPLASRKACNANPENGDLGIQGAKIIAPGSPQTSLLSLRMHTLDTSKRMPTLATSLVDTSGTKVIDDWIGSLTSCTAADTGP